MKCDVGSAATSAGRTPWFNGVAGVSVSGAEESSVCGAGVPPILVAGSAATVTLMMKKNMRRNTHIKICISCSTKYLTL